MCDFRNPYGYTCPRLPACQTFLTGPTGATGPTSSVPVGTILPYAGAAAPDGYLLCNGSAKVATLYAALFAVVGYTFGGAAGTFLLPDLRGRAPIGAGIGAGLTPRALGDVGGEETVSLILAEIPTHNHAPSTVANFASVEVQPGTGVMVTGDRGTGATLPVSIPPNGGGDAHANMQPFLALNFIIKY